jgi:hypothetical protein
MKRSSCYGYINNAGVFRLLGKPQGEKSVFIPGLYFIRVYGVGNPEGAFKLAKINFQPVDMFFADCGLFAHAGDRQYLPF